jgi:amidophosphoribosyltransferase
MAKELGADSLRYLPVESIASALNRSADDLCRACITGRYPTAHGQKLYQIALANAASTQDANANGTSTSRTYETSITRG